MSTNFFTTLISTFDNHVYHNIARSNEGNPLVLQIRMNPFNVFAETIILVWNRCMTLLTEDAAKGKEHLEKEYKLFDTPGVMRDRLSDCLAQLFKVVNKEEEVFLEPAKKGVLENAAAIKLIYQKVVLNWEEYNKDPQLFIKQNVFPVIMAHCLVPALSLYKGVSVLDREVLLPQDIVYLKLSKEEVSKERDCTLDCASWALLSLRVDAFAPEIKARYLNKETDSKILFAPLSHLRARGLHPVKDPKPGDLVMYRKGSPAFPMAEESDAPCNPDEPTHFGILAADGYVHSKLTACTGVKIFRHKIWQVYEYYGREVIFLRYQPK